MRQVEKERKEKEREERQKAEDRAKAQDKAAKKAAYMKERRENAAVLDAEFKAEADRPSIKTITHEMCCARKQKYCTCRVVLFVRVVERTLLVGSAKTTKLQILLRCLLSFRSGDHFSLTCSFLITVADSIENKIR